MTVIRRVNRLASLFLLISLFACPVWVSESAQKPICSGSVAIDFPAVMHKRLSPLTEYLSAQHKRPVVQSNK